MALMESVFCTKCAVQNQMESVYCFKCGNKLQKEVISTIATTQVEEKAPIGISGNIHSGLIVHFNGNFKFDGKCRDDSLTVNLPNKFPKFLDGERTISAWFRTTKDDGIIASIGSNIPYTEKHYVGNEQFAISARKDGVMLYGGRDQNDFLFSNSPNYLDNKWRHLVVTKQGNNARLYINSKFIGKTKDHRYSTGGSNKQYIMIGAWNDPNRYFEGDIGDVRIYNKAINQYEICALWKQNAQRIS
eukprot:116982_1